MEGCQQEFWRETPERNLVVHLCSSVVSFMLFGFATPLSPWRKKTYEFFSLSYLLNQGIPIILLTAVKFCVFNKGGLQREVSLNDRPKKRRPPCIHA